MVQAMVFAEENKEPRPLKPRILRVMKTQVKRIEELEPRQRSQDASYDDRPS